jgi:hypothetical protein
MEPTLVCSEDAEGAVAPVDVQVVMRGVRRRAWAARRERSELLRAAGRIVSPALAAALGSADIQIQHMRQCARLIGALPPIAPTLRGRVGAVLVTLVRRALFWFIPPLKDSQTAALAALEEQRCALREITLALRDLNAKLIATQETDARQPGISKREPE